ncbi:MAG: Fic family protein [Cyclobacteriaceae bacterium]|nr:Fic family protein [Cyclobacteriaceae bacterium]
MRYSEKLARINELQKAIDAYGALSLEVKKKINYKFRLDWNYYSNRMEGGTLTREETRSVMVGNIDVNGKPIKDVMEMNGHDKVVLEILKVGSGKTRISEKRIKEIHKAIMHEEGTTKFLQIGQWKATANEIINYRREKISFTPPDEVADAVHNLLNRTNAELDRYFDNKESPHPIEIASSFHIGYVSIHPFYDGNGRSARIIHNLILIACGLPPIILKDSHKQSYYQLLADIQAYGGNAQLFYSFIADRVIESQQVVLDAIAGKEIDEPDDLDKRIELLKKQLINPDVVTESKSLYATNRVLKESVFPLLQNLESKLDKITDLFNSKERVIQYTEQENYRELGTTESDWETFYKWVDKRTPNSAEVDPKGVNSFSYRYQLKGFKKSLELQYLPIHFDFQFREFDFTFSHNNSFLIRRFGYNQTIDSRLANEIVKEVIDKVLSQIAEASNLK